MLRMLFFVAIGIFIARELRAEPLAFEVELSLTGSHPVQHASWDGPTLYLPVQLPTTSPPDMVACIFTGSNPQPHCLAQSNGESICPDRERCTLSGAMIDTNQTISIVVLDRDDFAGAASQMLSGAMDQLSIFDVAEVQNLIAKGKGVAKKIRNADGAFEYMDALILHPEGGSDDQTIEAISRNMRAFLQSATRFSALKVHDRRIEGRFDRAILEDCIFPSPSCRTDYVFIQLTEKE